MEMTKSGPTDAVSSGSWNAGTQSGGGGSVGRNWKALSELPLVTPVA
jgi:hypothetical protein